jgi:hypothetical protein
MIRGIISAPAFWLSMGALASTTTLKGERGGWLSSASSYLLATCTAMALQAIVNA